MKSLRVLNGDIVIEGGRLVEVEGLAKTRQDLGISMREPYGCDPYHPQWGSLLASYIGQPITKAALGVVRSEALRLVKNYMAGQRLQLQTDSLARQASRMSSDEVIKEITDISLTQTFDVIHLRVTFKTLSNQEITAISTTRG